MPDKSAEGPLRVVVDPNVFVSAAISNGISRRLIDLAAAGALQLVACRQLVDELHRVLQRERFLQWRTRPQLDGFEAALELLVEMEPDPETIPEVTRDPGDDYLVALALAAGADRLCSGDHDFDDVREPRVVTPGDLVREVLGQLRRP